MSVKIKSIKCHKVLNSRAVWTIETRVELSDGSVGLETVPNGASKGENEAIYIDPEKAIDIVEHPIFDMLEDIDPFNQKEIDHAMIDLDGTPNKSHLGGNSILSVSLAVAKACAVSRDQQLYQYLADLYGTKLKKKLLYPALVFNILNGGKHAQNNLSFQEFMVIPSPKKNVLESIEVGVKVYKTLKGYLEGHGYSTGVGDEGGFAPSGFTVEQALDFIRDSVVSAGYEPGKDVFFGMDVAAESFYEDGKYNIKEQSIKLNATELKDFYKKLSDKYEIIYLEDPYYENDPEAWKILFPELKDKLMIVGDDLVVTNPKFLNDVKNKQMINSVIVKPNQVGTLTETLEFIRTAKNAGMTTCISHRSGDTAEDTFIADLAIAVESEYMKSGAPARGERVVKYNRLLDIYDNILE